MSYKINFNNNFKLTEEASEPLLKRWVLQTAIEFITLKSVIEELEFYSADFINLLELEKWQSEPVAKNEKDKVIKHIKKQWHRISQDNAVLINNNILIKNIKLLTELLSLSSLEIKLLMFTLFIRNFKALEEITDKLGNNISNNQLANLLSVLFCQPQQKIIHLLSPSNKLITTGIIELENDERHIDRKLMFVSSRFADALVAKPLTIDEIIKEFAIISSSPSLCLDDYAHIQHQLDILQPYLEKALVLEKQGVNIFIYGPPGTGKTQLAKLLADTIETTPVNLYEISALDENGKVRSGDARLKALTACQNFIQNNQSIVLIDEVEDIFCDSTLLSNSTATESKAWLTSFLEHNRLPTVWVSNSIDGVDPAFLRRFDFIFELDIPSEQHRIQIIKRECGELVSEQTISELASHTALSPAVINRASHVIKNLPHSEVTERSSALKLIINNTLKAQGHQKLQTIGLNNTNKYSTQYINADKDMDKVIAGLKAHSEGRLCLYGPPGTGKTAFGHFLAKQLNKRIIVQKASDLISSYVGGTEQNLAKAFEQATKESAILMLDEVDSFLQDRKSASHSWEITAVNEMLTQMEAFQGIFIASTNLMNNLDEASIRRFDLKVKLNYLTNHQIISMFEECAKQLSLKKTLDLCQLTNLVSVTPGDFALISRQHKFNAITTDGELYQALQKEIALKGEAQTRAIGFIQ